MSALEANWVLGTLSHTNLMSTLEFGSAISPLKCDRRFGFVKILGDHIAGHWREGKGGDYENLDLTAQMAPRCSCSNVGFLKIK